MVNARLQSYVLEVERQFRLLCEQQVDTPGFRRSLVNTIVRCFHLPAGRMSRKEKAKIILSQLFLQFSLRFYPDTPFHLPHFLQTYVREKGKINLFLTTILTGFYFEDIDLIEFRLGNRVLNLEFLLLQLLAPLINRKKLSSILIGLDLNKQTALICYCYKRYREGSYTILKNFELLFSQQASLNLSPNTRDLLYKLKNGLERKYFFNDSLYNTLVSSTAVTETFLIQLCTLLETEATQQMQEFLILLKHVVKAIIESPARTHEARRWVQQKKSWDFSSSDVSEDESLQYRKKLDNLFREYLPISYSIEEIQHWAKIFGLEGHVPLFTFQGTTHPNTLVERMRFLHLVFTDPLLLAQIGDDQKREYIAFVLAIILQLEAINKKPEKYKIGLEKMICAIPTKDKDLSLLPGLPSLLKGLKSVVDYLNNTLLTPTSLKNYPIFVFDQSEERLFEKNQRTLEQLSRQYSCSIIHLSTKDALSLAKILSLEPLINTTGKGSFGFGGARNCVFLLTPVFKRAMDKGCTNPSQVLAMDASKLIRLFQEHVLGGVSSSYPCGDTLFMIDDDIEVPEANLFSHLFYAQARNDQYTHVFGFSQGRATKGLTFTSLNYVLHTPRNSFIFTRWVDIPVLAGMSEYISKPKFCLNIPFGSEEGHYIGKIEITPLLQCSKHLGGVRHPSRRIPSHVFVGMETFLEIFIPYSLTLLMASELITSPLHKENNVLPWNDSPVPSFHNLRELFSYASKDKVKQEIKKRFWKNIRRLFQPTDEETQPDSKNSLHLLQYIQELIQMDVGQIIQTIIERERLDYIEKASLKKMASIYLFYQQDAKLFWSFGEAVIQALAGHSSSWLEAAVDPINNLTALIEHIKTKQENDKQLKFSDFPLTQGLYLIMHAVGAGEFCERIKAIPGIMTAHDCDLCAN